MQLKSYEDIALIWQSGQIASRLHDELRQIIKPGVTTGELDQAARRFIEQHQAQPTFLGYRGYPAAVCVSINDEIVHGIPGERVIQEDDLVSIDLGVTYKHRIADTAKSWIVTSQGAAAYDQQGNDAKSRLCRGTEQSLYAGIDAVAEGSRLREVSRAVQNVLQEFKLGIVRELTGHGVGFELHEEPTIYNFDTGLRGPVLGAGCVLAIEPMATTGSEMILLAADEWTYKTMDGSLAAHYEHTVTLWDGEVFILTDHTDDRAAQAFQGGAL
ncbi:type I methionyl aminopeptidase [bacterium]|nr:type I methionyl aminopeptidase [bacterium]